MISKSEKETIQLGEKLGNKLQVGMVLTLKGDLAGGKTTFTKGIGKALNIKQVINSPTFTILKIYEGDKKLFHIDAYRLENNSYDLGLEEYEDEGIMVIEWPEYYKDFLPNEYLEINFKYIDDDTRSIEFNGKGDRYQKIVEELNV
ncbi:MAG: tRNA (adenosine(37)-N6)-threonylcarbamoyltransferase complex ATPase subunit type 1 TsaE [Erysipelotrichaceae bacterium]|nr:tRNA (adenosine(37)-N6)-threonylcarbamoyltransferase complex ATPase subunit type 1 TsaE [Erysipelotrichaceae bacterium]